MNHTGLSGTIYSIINNNNDHIHHSASPSHFNTHRTTLPLSHMYTPKLPRFLRMVNLPNNYSSPAKQLKYFMYKTVPRLWLLTNSFATHYGTTSLVTRHNQHFAAAKHNNKQNYRYYPWLYPTIICYPPISNNSMYIQHNNCNHKSIFKWQQYQLLLQILQKRRE